MAGIVDICKKQKTPFNNVLTIKLIKRYIELFAEELKSGKVMPCGSFSMRLKPFDIREKSGVYIVRKPILSLILFPDTKIFISRNIDAEKSYKATKEMNEDF